MSCHRQSIRWCVRQSGFSLVEAVFVCAIVAILGAIALPRYAGFVARQQTQSAARRILSDLTYAQRQARLTSTPRSVVFDVGSGEYALPGMADPDRIGRSYSVDLSHDPYRATIISAAFGGDSTVVFDGFGTADTPGEIVVSVGRYRQTITVDGGLNRPRIAGQVLIEAIE